MIATAPAGLDAGQRSKLERLVTRARVVLETDLAGQAEGRFGIHLDGAIEAEGALPADASDTITRRDLEQIVAHLRTLGEDAPGAVARLLREAAFTHVNRLVAIRMAEAIGLLPETLAKGAQSRGFKDLGEIMPMVADDYWAYLRMCGDELAPDAPALFDPRNPLLALAPSTGALDELVSLVADPTATAIWTAPDTLGWVYQFFNTGDERRQMRDESSAPRNSRELAVRNQFFTPRYVVDFLVENTLGRCLAEAGLLTSAYWEPPVDDGVPEEPTRSQELGEIRILDPACGSGHFLLASYDLLERAWANAGVSPTVAARRILRCLWGVDIDPRCAQVAGAALMLRARRSCPMGTLDPPNIATARALPDDPEAWEEAMGAMDPNLRGVVRVIDKVVTQAPLLGSLLRVDKHLTAEVQRSVPAAITDEDTLFGSSGSALHELRRIESAILDAVRIVADRASSTAPQRLLAAEAADALRFMLAMRQRYDVVLMNPPFGLPVEITEAYLQEFYPATWTDLYACFIERGRELCRPDGYLGAIVSSQWFTTRTMRDFRRTLIREANPVALVDLGASVLEGATVNTCMICVPGGHRKGRTEYADLTGFPRLALGASAIGGVEHITIDFGLFDLIDGCPIAVHVPSPVLERWSAKHRLEPDLALVRTGNHTFDDFRFLRCSWEIIQRDGWLPFQKGGPYCPYWASTRLLLDWRRDGEELRSYAVERVGNTAQVLQSSSLWFKSGLTYPHVSSVGFGVRVLPSGEVFSSESISIFPHQESDRLPLLGLLNSTIAAEILQVFGRNRKFENGAIKALPFGPEDLQHCAASAGDVEELIRVFATLEILDETSNLFRSPFPSREATGQQAINDCTLALLNKARRYQAAIDEVVADALSISDRIDPSVAARADLIERAMPPQLSPADWIHRTLSYLLGVAFGRWDVRQAFAESDMGDDLFRALSTFPPGMLLSADGTPGGELEIDYPVQVPTTRLLVDEAGHQWDIEAAVMRAADAVFKGSAGIVSELLKSLGPKSVRDHLRKKFFKAHLSQYSMSRRKAPIYWPLSVPSGTWGVWVYAPALSRETLYAVAGEAGRRERLAAEAIARLHREQQQGGSGRSAQKVAAELETEERLAEELHQFRSEAERLGGLGWEPNLDDGIILCAAPLADLFPSWPEAESARAELRKGEFDWASVASWAGQL